MAKLLRLGNPILREISVPVTDSEIPTKSFQTFLDRLSDTCVKQGGVGIAAVQTGTQKRVIVVNIDPTNPRYPDKKPFPLTIVINPVITKRSKITKEDWEGDLCVNLRALVPRGVSCVVKGLDRYGKPVVYELNDEFHARVFQHEIDHLDGVMFLDIVVTKKSFCEYRQWLKYYKGKDPQNLHFR